MWFFLGGGLGGVCVSKLAICSDMSVACKGLKSMGTATSNPK